MNTRTGQNTKDKWFPFLTVIVHWRTKITIVIFPALSIIILAILIFVLRQYSSNFWVVLLLSFFLALFLACSINALYIKRNNKNIEERWKEIRRFMRMVFPALTIISLLLSADNDVVTQRDGLSLFKRIYNKESKVNIYKEDVFSALREERKSRMVFVLDVSGSTQESSIEDIEVRYVRALLNKVYMRFNSSREMVSDDLCKKFFSDILKCSPSEFHESLFLNDNILKKITEYSIHKLRLFDILLQVQNNCEVGLVCLGTNIKISSTTNWEKGYYLNPILEYIKEQEKNENNRAKTNFVKLFEVLKETYKEDSLQISFAFFSDYIHDPKEIEHIETETLRRVTREFCSQPHFNNFYYSGSEEKYRKRKVFNILKEVIRTEVGRFSPINEDFYLFLKHSPKIIPIYYEYSYSSNPIEYKTQIIFNEIKLLNNYEAFIEKNEDDGDLYHHRFAFDDVEMLSVLAPRSLANKSDLVLRFSGRVAEQFPGHSFVLQPKKGEISYRGYYRFDIVFFKDFPWYVRWVVTILLIDILLWIFLHGFYLYQKREKEKEKETKQTDNNQMQNNNQVVE